MLYEDIGQSGGGQFERLLRSDNILTDLYHSVLQVAPTEASDCFWREVGACHDHDPKRNVRLLSHS
jgi:hypothetical protein